MVALAAILDGLEQSEEAERLYLDALRMFEELPRADVEDVAVALNNLAALYQEARGIFEQSLGADHPKAIACRSNEIRCSAEAGDMTA